MYFLLHVLKHTLHVLKYILHGLQYIYHDLKHKFLPIENYFLGNKKTLKTKKDLLRKQILFSSGCRERDSNPHSCNSQGILSPSCLPFHHRGRP